MVIYRVKKTRRKLNFFEYTLFYRYDFGTIYFFLQNYKIKSMLKR